MSGKEADEGAAVEEIGREMMDLLARRFPVSCASDEYYFFPQATLIPVRWQQWDRTGVRVADTVDRLREYAAFLKKAVPRGGGHR